MGAYNQIITEIISAPCSVCRKVWSGDAFFQVLKKPVYNII